MLRYAFLSVEGINLKPKNIFTGSAIRGCFGYALRAVVCPFIDSKCQNCYMAYKCLFYKIYETPKSNTKFKA
ncbi:hypothetical protein F1B92_06845 [Campylobacter sp. FMV-PI01]|uniref:Uncharacterized protein n=1 Tax=Campylobacter portucalensis TaxID=2608384 RepID=A0A6L5WKD5_9BACT|nr:hypothetical protein [Campylobacter portucalensis]MSN96882.1 hypothetical protein [Campylobacter portucalensis]